MVLHAQSMVLYGTPRAPFVYTICTRLFCFRIGQRTDVSHVLFKIYYVALDRILVLVNLHRVLRIARLRGLGEIIGAGYYG